MQCCKNLSAEFYPILDFERQVGRNSILEENFSISTA